MLKGYRTIIFNVIMTVAMVFSLWNPGSDAPDAETVNAALDALDAALVAIWGIGNGLLRAVTTTPIFKKDDQGK